MPRGQQKDIEVLKRKVRERGYKTVPSGSGHWKVLDEKGRVVTDKDGPLILSSTSSEVRSRAMSVSRLVNAGVLLADPWAPPKGKQVSYGDNVEPVDDAEQARIEREMEERRLADQQHGERTLAIRERLEPVVTILGGWDKRGMLREIGIVAHYFATHAPMPPDAHPWTSPEAAAENADSLRRGATLSPTMAPLWEGLLAELEAWPDVKVRWMQLLREAKGLDPPTIGDTTSEPVAPEPAPEREQPPVSGEGGRLPSLALRVAYEIGVGRTGDDPYRRELRQLIEEVAQLELAVEAARAARAEIRFEDEPTGEGEPS